MSLSDRSVRSSHRTGPWTFDKLMATILSKGNGICMVIVLLKLMA